MSQATFILSAFADEIAPDLHTQLSVLRSLQIGYLELRNVNGRNVVDLGDSEALALRRTCEESGITISCIGSPVGKSPIEEAVQREQDNLQRLFDIAKILGTLLLRIFSFYPPEDHAQSRDDYLPRAAERLGTLADFARGAGITLLLENEKGLVGDTPQRCHALLQAVDSPNLRFAWDPANFVQVGVEAPTQLGWSMLQGYISHVHIKDAVLADSSICPAGEGDGQVSELLAHLKENGYQGFLALEPHLLVAGHSGGFSGPEGMARAAVALRRLMGERGCVESQG